MLKTIETKNSRTFFRCRRSQEWKPPSIEFTERKSALCRCDYPLVPAFKHLPHPEEHAEGVRLEGWATGAVLAPTLRDASLRDAPQGEVTVESPPDRAKRGVGF